MGVNGRLDRLEQVLAPGDRRIPFDQRVRARGRRADLRWEWLSDAELDWLYELGVRCHAEFADGWNADGWNLDVLAVAELEELLAISLKLELP